MGFKEKLRLRGTAAAPDDADFVLGRLGQEQVRQDAQRVLDRLRTLAPSAPDDADLVLGRLGQEQVRQDAQRVLDRLRTLAPSAPDDADLVLGRLGQIPTPPPVEPLGFPEAVPGSIDQDRIKEVFLAFINTFADSAEKAQLQQLFNRGFDSFIRIMRGDGNFYDSYVTVLWWQRFFDLKTKHNDAFIQMFNALEREMGFSEAKVKKLMEQILLTPIDLEIFDLLKEIPAEYIEPLRKRLEAAGEVKNLSPIDAYLYGLILASRACLRAKRILDKGYEPRQAEAIAQIVDPLDEEVLKQQGIIEKALSAAGPVKKVREEIDLLPEDEKKKWKEKIFEIIKHGLEQRDYSKEKLSDQEAIVCQEVIARGWAAILTEAQLEAFFDSRNIGKGEMSDKKKAFIKKILGMSISQYEQILASNFFASFNGTTRPLFEKYNTEGSEMTAPALDKEQETSQPATDLSSDQSPRSEESDIIRRKKEEIKELNNPTLLARLSEFKTKSESDFQKEMELFILLVAEYWRRRRTKKINDDYDLPEIVMRRGARLVVGKDTASEEGSLFKLYDQTRKKLGYDQDFQTAKEAEERKKKVRKKARNLLLGTLGVFALGRVVATEIITKTQQITGTTKLLVSPVAQPAWPKNSGQAGQTSTYPEYTWPDEFPPRNAAGGSPSAPLPSDQSTVFPNPYAEAYEPAGASPVSQIIWTRSEVKPGGTVGQALNEAFKSLGIEVVAGSKWDSGKPEVQEFWKLICQMMGKKQAEEGQQPWYPLNFVQPGEQISITPEVLRAAFKAGIINLDETVEVLINTGVNAPPVRLSPTSTLGTRAVSQK